MASRQARPEHHEQSTQNLPIADRGRARVSLDFSKISIFPPAGGDRREAAVPRTVPIQAKLRVGAVNDPLEHEADRVANQVMSIREPNAPGMKPASVKGATGPSLRRCAACEEGELQLHAKAEGGGATAGSQPAALNGEVSKVMRSSGQRLDSQTRAFMEPRFGHDFGDIRVHTDGDAARSASRIGALAYTVGRDVVFAPGKFSPATAAGKRLLAHELTHVVQQSNGDGRDQSPHRITRANAQGQLLQRAPDSSDSIREQIVRDEARFEVQVESNLTYIASGVDYMKTPKFATLPTETQITLAQLVMGECKNLKDLMDSQDRAIAAEIDWEQAAERAEESERIAQEAAARASRWRNRLTSYVKAILHTVEGVVVCPLAETGIGAVGCTHAITALGADSLTIMSGEPQRNAFEQTGYGVAKAVGANEQQANQAAFAVDFAGGAASSFAPFQKAAYLAQMQNNAYASARAAAAGVGGKTAVASAPGILGRSVRNLSFTMLLGKAQAGAAGTAETALINEASRTSVTLVEGRVASTLDGLTSRAAGLPSAVSGPTAWVPGAAAAATAGRASAALQSAATIRPVLGQAGTVAATLPSARPQVAPASQSPATRTAPSGGSTSVDPRILQARTRQAFMDAALRVILANPHHRLSFLLDGRDWRKTTRVTRSGRRQTGRYEGNEHGVVVQAGHQTARASGAIQQFALEDANFNQVDNNVIESKGCFSMKCSVVIDGVPVDIRSSMHWEGPGGLDPGTTQASPRIEPPGI